MSFVAVTLKLLEGFSQTVLIFALTLVAAIPLGLVVAFGSMSRFKPLSWLVRTFVWIIRGTPLMLQCIIVFYGPGLIFNTTALPRLTSVLIAFIINYAAYFSEIYRGGIESIPRGQYEAGPGIGHDAQPDFLSCDPGAGDKRIVPPMSNEIITLVKDTSLARIIAVREIIMEAQSFISTYALIWPLFYSGAFYLAFNGLLTLLFGYIEKKMSYYKV